MSRLEDELRAALLAGTRPIEPAPDLFARVEEGGWQATRKPLGDRLQAARSQG